MTDLNGFLFISVYLLHLCHQCSIHWHTDNTDMTDLNGFLFISVYQLHQCHQCSIVIAFIDVH